MGICKVGIYKIRICKIRNFLGSRQRPTAVAIYQCRSGSGAGLGSPKPGLGQDTNAFPRDRQLWRIPRKSAGKAPCPGPKSGIAHPGQKSWDFWSRGKILGLLIQRIPGKNAGKALFPEPKSGISDPKAKSQDCFSQDQQLQSVPRKSAVKAPFPGPKSRIADPEQKSWISDPEAKYWDLLIQSKNPGISHPGAKYREFWFRGKILGFLFQRQNPGISVPEEKSQDFWSRGNEWPIFFQEFRGMIHPFPGIIGILAPSSTSLESPWLWLPPVAPGISHLQGIPGMKWKKSTEWTRNLGNKLNWVELKEIYGIKRKSVELKRN